MDNFFEIFLKSELKDILVSGYIECDEITIFKPMYDRLYFVFEETILEFGANSFWSIDVRAIKKIEPWFEVEEDDIFGVSSIYSQCFSTELSIRALSLCYYIDPTNADVLFFCLNYSIGERCKSLFINPKNTFGFSFSDSEDEEDAWLWEAHAAKIPIRKEVKSAC
ncbi:hypothetical protein [Massilia aquatica]|uniref:DUF4240 domain-containing protein n=1 Tax=Massilia aquatica TaxID=2609000 RepID=A0ABX0M668_9BURK|nr:hypothetical protein [Massilia aquatica]NHZ40525.1 hypothetical protein [Massilia aquatica]